MQILGLIPTRCECGIMKYCLKHPLSQVLLLNMVEVQEFFQVQWNLGSNIKLYTNHVKYL